MDWSRIHELSKFEILNEQRSLEVRYNIRMHTDASSLPAVIT